MERAGTVVGKQLHDQARQVSRVNDLNRLLRVAGHGHPAAPGRAPHPVGEPRLPVVRPGDLSRPHDRRPGAVPGHHVVFAGDLERAVGVVGQFLGVPDGRPARCVLGGTRPYPVELVHRVAGDEQVPPGPLPQRIHGLAHVAGDVAADIHDRVPATGAERRVVAGIPVAGQSRQAREQAGPGLPPAEQGHLGSGSQRVLNDGAAHKRRTAKHENPHSLEPFSQPPARNTGRSGAGAPSFAAARDLYL